MNGWMDSGCSAYDYLLPQSDCSGPVILESPDLAQRGSADATEATHASHLGSVPYLLQSRVHVVQSRV